MHFRLENPLTIWNDLQVTMTTKSKDSMMNTINLSAGAEDWDVTRWETSPHLSASTCNHINKNKKK